MSVQATLSLLRALVDEHLDRSPGSETVVLPCVHEDADTPEDSELFAAAVRRAGGVYVNCGPQPNQFPGPLNGAMSRGLTRLCLERGIEVDITEVGGQIQVLVDGSEGLTPSASTFAQVLALLCSEQMRTEFLVYSYSTDGLDEARASTLWAAGWIAQHFAHEQLRTMAYIACGWVNVVQHCNTVEGSARLVVRGTDLIRRPPRRNPDSRVQTLLKTLDEPIVLFLGAGASASARIPQGDTLRDSAIHRLTGVNGSSEDLTASFRQWLQDNPHRYLNGERDLTRKQFDQALTLERVLREEFHHLSGRPRSESSTYQEIKGHCDRALDRNPSGREAIHRLAELLPRLIIATVNFDELVEQGMSAEHQVVASVEDFRGSKALISDRISGRATTVPILKVHGTITDADTIVADIGATRRGLPIPVEEALDGILTTADPVTWIWIGCSMRDLDLRPWLMRHSAEQLIEFWVDPLPPQSVADYAADVRAKEWAKIDHSLADRQITESSDIFLPLFRDRALAISQSPNRTSLTRPCSNDAPCVKQP